MKIVHTYERIVIEAKQLLILLLPELYDKINIFLLVVTLYQFK